VLKSGKNKYSNSDDKECEDNPLPHLLDTQNTVCALCTRKSIDIGSCKMRVSAVVGSTLNTAFGGSNRRFADDFAIAFNSAKELGSDADYSALNVRSRANYANELVCMRVEVLFSSQPVEFGNRAVKVCTRRLRAPVAFRAKRR
jgi:hypothetical protein